MIKIEKLLKNVKMDENIIQLMNLERQIHQSQKTLEFEIKCINWFIKQGVVTADLLESWKKNISLQEKKINDMRIPGAQLKIENALIKEILDKHERNLKFAN